MPFVCIATTDAARSEFPQVLESVWASKIGGKVLPDWMSMVDDPTVEEAQGVGLVGAYSVDDEGVKGQKVTIVDKGTLKGFLTSRQPVREVDSSNGHGRLPGGYGSQEGVIGSLFVQSFGRDPRSSNESQAD